MKAASLGACIMERVLSPTRLTFASWGLHVSHLLPTTLSVTETYFIYLVKTPGWFRAVTGHGEFVKIRFLGFSLYSTFYPYC